MNERCRLVAFHGKQMEVFTLVADAKVTDKPSDHVIKALCLSRRVDYFKKASVTNTTLGRYCYNIPRSNKVVVSYNGFLTVK